MATNKCNMYVFCMCMLPHFTSDVSATESNVNQSLAFTCLSFICIITIFQNYMRAFHAFFIFLLAFQDIHIFYSKHTAHVILFFSGFANCIVGFLLNNFCIDPCVKFFVFLSRVFFIKSLNSYMFVRGPLYTCSLICKLQ